MLKTTLETTVDFCLKLKVIWTLKRWLIHRVHAGFPVVIGWEGEVNVACSFELFF